MRTIDFEAHFITDEWLAEMYRNPGSPRYVRDDAGKMKVVWGDNAIEPIGQPLLDKLLDLGDDRLALLDANGIDMQVVSLTIPGVEQLPVETAKRLARQTNDALAEVIRRHPDRYAGFASLAPQDPTAAADELERAVTELGLKGWKTHSNYGDSYLDEPRYRPIFERAADLGIPVYLHPSFPAIKELRTEYGWALAGAPFGFGIETAMTMMRLIFSGAFDRSPKLTVILGHLGEALPFLLSRIDYPFVIPWFDPAERPKLDRKPSDYFRDNIYVSTSGMYFAPAFECTRQALGIERILLGTDYPYEDPAVCMQFMNGLDIPNDEKGLVYSGNAARLGF